MSDKDGNTVKPSVDELRAEIQQTRSELGETVQALAAKADVKARAKDQVELTKQKVKAQAAEAGEKVRVAAVAAGDKVRAVAGQASDKVTAAAGEASDKVSQTSPRDFAYEAKAQARNSPVPLSLLFAGVAAVVGVILIVRGSRR
jgi:cobalamin biosynthesis Mg chelatase CobN